MSQAEADQHTSKSVQRASARGFAVGVALAAAATVVLRRYVVPLGHDIALDTHAMAVGYAIAVPSGLAGGWLVWRWSGVRPHASLGVAIGVAIGASLLSIWIACGVGGAMAAVEAVIATGRLHDALVSVASGLFVAPIFYALLFGPILIGLVTAWSLVWRLRVNR